MLTIDLNADLGEGEASDAELMAVVSSCNIACGGHAGDEKSMSATVALAMANGVSVGAHPAYPDRDGFGRRSRFVEGPGLYASLTEQAGALADIAARLGCRVRHVKPHGALYNDAWHDPQLARVLARVALEIPGDAALVGQPGSAMQQAATEVGVRYITEGFVDRAYAADGSLVPRSEPGAVLEERRLVAEQAVSIATGGGVLTPAGDRVALQVDTLCIHGDTPGAVGAARAVRAALDAAGVRVRAPGGSP